jgi:hypothetical protein
MLPTHPLKSPKVLIPPDRGGFRVDDFLDPADGLFHSSGISSAAAPDRVVGPLAGVGADDVLAAEGGAGLLVPTVSK